MFAPCLLSFFTGFLALSQISLWLRLFAFAKHSLLGSIFVMTVFVVGILLGIRIGERFCRGRHNLWEISGVLLLSASFFDVISPWFYASFVSVGLQVMIGGMFIVLTVALKAMIFPIVQYLGLAESAAETPGALPRVYVALIVGAILGSVLTGVVLLSLFSIPNCFVLLAVGTFLVSVFCFREIVLPTTRVMISLFAVVIFSFILLQEVALLVSQATQHVSEVGPVVLNQHDIAVVSVVDDMLPSGVLIFGDKGFDVRASFHPVINTQSALLLTAPPQHVLMIGLSLGAWMKLLTSFPEVKNIDIVEINPSSLSAIKSRAKQKKVVSLDPRVHLSVEDGRRWLVHHPKQRYDLIVVNTTCYWRTCATRLLSREFLALLQKHVAVGGALAYSSAGSRYVLKAAATNFDLVDYGFA